MKPPCCEELNRLRVQVREQADELAEWRRQDHAGHTEVIEGDRIAVVRRALGEFRGRGGSEADARLLLQLLDHAGTPQKRGALMRAFADGDPGDYSPNYLRVRICFVRIALGRLGLTDVIRTIGGGAYLIERPAAARTMAAIGLGGTGEA